MQSKASPDPVQAAEVTCPASLASQVSKWLRIQGCLVLSEPPNGLSCEPHRRWGLSPQDSCHNIHAEERGSNFFLPGKAPSAGNAFSPQAGLAHGLHLQTMTLPYVLFLCLWAVPALLLHQPSTLLCGSVCSIPLQGHMTLQKGWRPSASIEGPSF